VREKGFALPLVLLSVALVVILVGGVVYSQLRSKANITSQLSSKSSNRSKLTVEKRGCPFYGVLDKDFYLTKYAVRRGDTLLSIAKNELGDSSRVDELIELNKTWYPHLSIQNPFIQVGWELRIPPKFFPKSSGVLEGVGGEVLEETEKWILIDLKYGQRVEQISYKTPQTKYLGKDSFKLGDCVYIVKDSSGRAEAGVLAISPQDKNYFKDSSTAEIKVTREKKCPYYGFLDKDFFLSKYKVRKGDTLSSVAKNELGDDSRVEELIQLNKPGYPHLSIQDPFIEVGWELRLPPKFISKSTGALVGLGGELLEETEESIAINLRYGQSGIDEGYYSYKSPKTKYLGQSSFQPGDCIYIIEDTGGTSRNTILAISPQDKNYFKD